MEQAAKPPQAEGWAAGAEGQTKALCAAGPSEQRAARQPDPPEGWGSPKKEKPTVLKEKLASIV